jgi:hypothetical protein
MTDAQISGLLKIIELQQAQINHLQHCAEKTVGVLEEISKTLHLLKIMGKV